MVDARAYDGVVGADPDRKEGNMGFQVGDEVVVLADYGGQVGVVEYAAVVREVVAAGGAAGGLYRVRYDEQHIQRRFGRQMVTGNELVFAMGDQQVAERNADIAAFTR